MTCQCPGPCEHRCYTTSYGSLVNYPHAGQRVSTNGPLVTQDFHLLDNLAHLGRERIPERVVHAKGAGAHGYFQLTSKDLSKITSQPIFHWNEKLGADQPQIPATVRFSTVAGELGSADTVRDINGFAIKLKTEQGVLDWVFLNTPIFFIRDPGKYPDLVHVTQRDPQTNRKNYDNFWDFFSQNPETIHEIMMLFSDLGTTKGFHEQNGYGGTTFKLVKVDKEWVYVKFHVIRKGGVKYLTAKEAACLAGANPDYGSELLYNAIEDAISKPKEYQFPEWTVKYQMMTPEEAASEKWRAIALDPTKIWPEDPFKLHDIGKLVLDRNPKNFFDEIEQLAYSPSHLIPYVEPSPDPLLQSRLFMYPDTQRYRLGVNNLQLKCNEPKNDVANYQRAGKGSYISQGNCPNYQSSIHPLCFKGPENAIDSQINDNCRQEVFHGSVDRFLSKIDPDEDYKQPRCLWLSWNKDEQERFVENVSESLRQVKHKEIWQRQVDVFKRVDLKLGNMLQEAVERGGPLPPPCQCEDKKPSTPA